MRLELSNIFLSSRWTCCSTYGSEFAVLTSMYDTTAVASSGSYTTTIWLATHLQLIHGMHGVTERKAIHLRHLHERMFLSRLTEYDCLTETELCCHQLEYQIPCANWTRIPTAQSGNTCSRGTNHSGQSTTSVTRICPNSLVPRETRLLAS